MLRVLPIGAAIVILFQAMAPPVRAQLGASLAIASDYRWRGLSLSDGEPAASLSLSYDHASGAYGGITGIAAAARHSGVEAVGYVAYLGYARRLSPGLSWDTGVTNSDTSVYGYREYSSDYTEVYAGLNGRNLSSHLYVSPDYLGKGGATLYADVDGVYRPNPRWRLFGHVGILTPLGRPVQPFAGHTRVDLLAGIARQFKRCELRLEATGTIPNAAYPYGYDQAGGAVVGSIAFFF